MKSLIHRLTAFFLALFLLIPAGAMAVEDPNHFNPSQSYYWYRGGEGPLPLPKAYFIRIPKDVRTYNRLGIDHFLQYDYTTALKYFQAARRLDPERPELLFNEALTLAKMNRHDEAAILFDKARHEAQATGNGLILHSPTLQAHLGNHA